MSDGRFPGRLLRTVGHLRADQIFQRVRLSARRARWSRNAARVDARFRARALELPRLSCEHPGLGRLAALRVGRRSPAEARAVADAALAGRFSFLEVTLDFGDEVDWYRADLDEGTRLWKTLLHEFPYAVDLARAERAMGDGVFSARLFALARSWDAASPIGRPGFALDAWNARAVARRLTNWAVAGSLLGLPSDGADADWLAQQLSVHALFLRENLEWDLRANHLLTDLVALVLAHELLGCAPEALDLLRGQLEEQVLADGCHLERVPLYHAHALQELAETRALLGDGSPAWLDAAVAKLAGFLEYLLPGDRRLPLLGDTWHYEVDPVRALVEAGLESEQPDSSVVAGASGLVVLRRGEAHAVVRAGAHGPDYQMGHAHADGLSFELTLGRDRVVTDTGTPTYDAGPARERARSTAAHNTLQLDGQEQIECWGSFRVGRRGRGRVHACGGDAQWSWLAASHDGWRWLPGRPLHRRLLALSETSLLVLDLVTGKGDHRLRSTLHLHPDLPDARAATFALGVEAGRQSAPLHERFNASRESTELYVEAEGPLPWLGGWIVVFGGAAGAPAVELHLRDGAAIARCPTPGLEFEVEWKPGAATARDSVQILPCPASAASAT